MTLTTGTTLEDRYRIEELLGAGGMGAVYRAYDIRLQQAVAIKENTMAVPGISPEVVEASRRQFEREARMLARLRHPNLPRVSDHFVTPDGNQYLVMDYIEGDDLAHIIARGGPLPEAQAIAWISQACSALEYLHTQDPPIIHRDIKPQNIKVTSKGVVFLVDFGIAKVGDVSKTATGALGVTPGFSPPEQYAMTGTDARSDIYALGATLYALLTAQTPPESVVREFGEKQLVPPRQINNTVSPAVQQAVSKAMETRPTRRPQSMAEFRQMLTTPGRYPDSAPDSAPPPLVSPTPVTPTPKPVPAPIAPPRFAAPPAYAERVRAERNPLPLLLAGAGIAAIVLVVLIVVAISSSKGAATPRPATATTSVPTATAEPPTITTAPTTAPAGSSPACTVIGQTWTSSQDNADLVCVPAGEFLMGSDQGGGDNEKPQHKVSLDAFWIDRIEVTNAQYKKCVQAGKCKASSYADDSKFNGDTQPVVGLDWNDAKTYCGWAGAALPTEAQWEKAARGTEGRSYPWGEQAPTRDLCNFWQNEKATTPVGKYSPQGDSPYGCVDMAGNVWEWVEDWYDANYYASSPSKNPSGPSSGQYRMLRGGGWDDGATSVRAAARDYGLPGYRHDGVGFRCVGSGPGG